MFSRALSRVTSSLFQSNANVQSKPETAPTTATALSNHSNSSKSLSPLLDLLEVLDRIGQHLLQEDLVRCMLVSRTFYHVFGQRLWTRVTIELRSAQRQTWSGLLGRRGRRAYRSQRHPGQWRDDTTLGDPMDRYEAKMRLFLVQLAKNIHHVRDLRIYYGNSIDDPSLVPDRTHTAVQIRNVEDAIESDSDDDEEDDPVYFIGMEYGREVLHQAEEAAQNETWQILGRIKDILQMDGLERLRRLSLTGDSPHTSGRSVPFELLIELGLLLPSAIKMQRLDSDGDVNGPALDIYPTSRFRNLQSLEIVLVENMSQLFHVQDVLRVCPLLENLKIERSAGPFVGVDHDDPSEPEMDSSRLKRLSFRGMCWPNKEFLALVRQCPQLISLTLIGHAQAPWSWTLETVEELARCCPGLTEIHINPGYFSTFQEELSTRLLEVLSRLKVFKIPCGDFGETTFQALMKVTTTTTHDASGRGLSKERRLISQLEELDLSSTKKPGLSNGMLVQLMSHAYDLRILNVSGISLNPRQFVIAEPDRVQDANETDATQTMLHQTPLSRQPAGWRCHRLEEITIGFATIHVTLGECRSIYGSLAQLPELRQIHILPNHLPLTLEAGLGQLATLKHLKHLDIHGVSNVGRVVGPAAGQKAMTEEVIQWMAQTWPKLESLRLYLDPPKRQSLDEVRQWLIEAGHGDVRIYVD